MQLSSEFFRLPYRFDVQRLAQELAGIAEDSWIPHPYHHRGNTALPLISLRGEDNDLFHGAMEATGHLKRLEYMQQVLASLGEVYGRSRLMRLEPGCEVPLHTDTNYHWHTRVRIHVPITTTPDVIFHCGDKQVHMGAGECWIFNAWQPHKVVNGSDQTRVHLVFDTAGSASFWETVARSQRPGVAATVADTVVPYEAGKRVQVLTEKYNATPVKSPGEVDGLVESLIADYEAASANPAAVMADYSQLLRHFAHDWRRLFSLYSYEKAGVPHYGGLIKAAADALEALPDTLVTASNQQAVRSIFFNRVLDAALEPALLADFLPPRGAAPRAAANKSAANRPAATKVGRNNPCPCGSGKKYKHCHG